jgi:aminoglycoside phosphotransferase
VYQITDDDRQYIVRIAQDEAHLAALHKEERIQRGLRERVTLLMPDTVVIDDLKDVPAFAIHRMVPGEPLVTEHYSHVSPQARARLIRDLVRFFHETHSVPWETACDWLGIPQGGARTAATLAATYGKPVWFDPDIMPEMREHLEPIIDDAGKSLFEDTVRRFQALEIVPDCMVFGHGDIHGYNVAMEQNSVGPKIIGVFDLECAGILDVHEDLFRLSLVSEELLEEVMAAYSRLLGQTRSLDRGRIAIYYRAFLFHLMIGKTGEKLEHLKRLLAAHVEHYAATYGDLD